MFSRRFNLEDFERHRIMGNLKQRRHTTNLRREFYIAHSIVPRLWTEFQRTVIFSRRDEGGCLQPLKTGILCYRLKKKSRSATANQGAIQFLAVARTHIQKNCSHTTVRKGTIFPKIYRVSHYQKRIVMSVCNRFVSLQLIKNHCE